jgi:uncharacterized membrane protein YdjX (TVP38/TMEM64 family)
MSTISESTINNSAVTPGATDTPKPVAKSSLKFKIYLVCMLGVILFLNVYPPAKDYLVSITEQIENLGWYGSILSTLFCGFIVIPAALPYYVVETALAYSLTSFEQPFLIGTISKFIGCSVCYMIAKAWFREKIMNMFSDNKLFRGITLMLERSPWKFSFIFRVSLMPYFIKNYGLAIPNCVNYFMYIIPATISGALLTAVNVHVTQTVKELTEYANSESGGDVPIPIANVLFSIISIGLFAYVGWYTYRIMKNMDKEPKTAVKQEKTD